MKVDPVIGSYMADSIGAEVLAYPKGFHLDPAIVQKLLDKVPIFRGLPIAGLLHTLALAEHYPIHAGDVVFHQGDLGDSFYVVIAGDVVVEKHGATAPVVLASLGPGSCFGEMGLVADRQRTATVRATTDAQTIRIDRAQVERNPETAFVIYRNIARILANRLENSSDMLADLTRRAPGH
jgi:CRP-like cAMP-binding protein